MQQGLCRVKDAIGSDYSSLAKDRIEWKKNRPRNVASPTWGINAQHITLQDAIDKDRTDYRRRGLQATLHVVLRARDRRWNGPGHILRLEQHRIIRQVLLS